MSGVRSRYVDTTDTTHAAEAAEGEEVGGMYRHVDCRAQYEWYPAVCELGCVCERAPRSRVTSGVCLTRVRRRRESETSVWTHTLTQTRKPVARPRTSAWRAAVTSSSELRATPYARLTPHRAPHRSGPQRARTSGYPFPRGRGAPFRVSRVVPVDLFPHTPHCELVVLCVREARVPRKSRRQLKAEAEAVAAPPEAVAAPPEAAQEIV